MKNEDALRWIESAESDFDLASVGKTSKRIQYTTLCYHNQQAVEKALKALLIFLDKEYPRTHDIETLLNLVKEKGVDIPVIVLSASDFIKYITWRYPDDVFEIEMEEYKESLKTASKTIEWVKAIIDKPADKLF